MLRKDQRLYEDCRQRQADNTSVLSGGGSPLFTRAEACPGIVFIKAGSLDSPELIEPTHQTWIEMAVPWAYLDKDLPAFEGNGPSPGKKVE